MSVPGRSRRFGTLADGTPVEAATIAAGSLTADLLSWGAALRDLRLDGVPHPLVLGFEDLASYVAHSPYFGAVVGRYANRIAAGRLTIGGANYELDRNEGGRHHLHGGFASFARRPWTLREAAADSVLFTLVSEDGDGGYPGRVAVSCRYAAEPPATWRLTLTAAADRPTVVNLAQHSYFNLEGGDSVLRHVLRIAAEAYLPVDEFGIPTGPPEAVAGSRFDFRAPRPVHATGASASAVYDHNFVLAAARRREPAFAARLEGGDGAVAMDVWTTEPGLQFYDGWKLAVPVPGLGGRRYGAHAGLCLEPQIWPDAPNRRDFPSPLLLPGETYRQVTELRFTAG